MKSSSIVFVVLAGVAVCAVPIQAQETVPPIEAEAVLSAADTFAMLMGDEQVGTQVVSLRREGDEFVFREETRTSMGEQATVVRMSADLAMRSVHQTGMMGGREMAIDVAYEAGWARGLARVPRRAGVEEIEVQAAVPEHVVDDNALIGLLPGMRLHAGSRLLVPVFQSGMNRLVEYVLTVDDAGSVEVPAGEYTALRVRATGGDSPIVFLVRAEAPHRVLAVEPQGSPLRLVRVGPR